MTGEGEIIGFRLYFLEGELDVFLPIPFIED